MVILIPFKLLKLKKRVEKERSKTNLDDLKKLIEDDIIGSINRNLEMGNIKMTDESLIFDIDIIEKQVEELQAEIEKKDTEIEMLKRLLAEKNR